jgi:hypothetical protein
MFKHAKADEMSSIYNQLLTMWNGLDLLLQLHIPMPTATTTVTEFLETFPVRCPLFVGLLRQLGYSSLPILHCYVKSISAFGLADEQLTTLSLTPSSCQTDSVSKGAIYETARQRSKAECSRVTIRHFFHWSLSYISRCLGLVNLRRHNLRDNSPTASGGPCPRKPYKGRWELRFWAERICAIKRDTRVAGA